MYGVWASVVKYSLSLGMKSGLTIQGQHVICTPCLLSLAFIIFLFNKWDMEVETMISTVHAQTKHWLQDVRMQNSPTAVLCVKQWNLQTR